MGCSYCYARRIYKRFKWNPEIRFDRYLIPEIVAKIKEPSRVFIGSIIELFGEWIYPHWLREIFLQVESFPQHTFIFLTKQPQNLIKWSPFPDNCWIGCSASNFDMTDDAIFYLMDIKAKVKFLSFEPLLDEIPIPCTGFGVDWLIIGQQTPVRKSTMPKIEWIKEIVDADRAKIPVFLKDNLGTIIPYGDKQFCIGDAQVGYKLRQEFPG